jgi:hypothetical protein
MPPLLQNSIEQVFVVPQGYLNLSSAGMPHERHLDKELMSLSRKTSDIDVAVDLGELGEGVVDDMFALEVCAILVEIIRHKDRNIVHPRIAGSSRQQDPVVMLGYSQELSRPVSRTNQSLLVKYEERSRHVSVLGDVVPGVDGEDVGIDSINFVKFGPISPVFIIRAAVS